MRDGMITGHDGTRLYYREFGKGQPVVLCDGIGCDGFIWKHLIPYLKDRYRFVHMHYRGHGKSQMPVKLENVGIEHLCHDIDCLFKELELPPAVLMGHSMGVQVIFEFAHLYPKHVAGLVPVCGSYGEPLNTFNGSSLGGKLIPYVKNFVSRHKSLVTLVMQTVVPSEIAWKVAINTEVNGELIDKDDFMPYLWHLGYVDPELFTTMLYHAQQHSAKAHMREFKVPALIVAGEFDGFTPKWLSEEMHQTIEGSEYIMFPSCGHTAPIELVDLFNLRIEKFMTAYFPIAEKLEKEKPAKAKPAKKKAPAKKKSAAKAAPKKSASKTAVKKKSEASETKKEDKPKVKKAVSKKKKVKEEKPEKDEKKATKKAKKTVAKKKKTSDKAAKKTTKKKPATKAETKEKSAESNTSKPKVVEKEAKLGRDPFASLEPKED